MRRGAKCKDCEHYDRIDNEKGLCVLNPPTPVWDGTQVAYLSSEVPKRFACAQFKGKKGDNPPEE